MERKKDLSERLIDFASEILDVAAEIPRSYAGNHLSSQLVRSGTSPALHYGEAEDAESADDFIHKMKVCLKELRETFNCLRLIKKRGWVEKEKLDKVVDENNQLISIFVTSIKTARNNNRKF